MKNLMDLTGKRALVTGGSRGIGNAMAQALHDAGAEVVFFYNSSDVTDLVATMQGDGAPVHAVQCNVADRSALEGAVAQAATLLGGGIDILINAAGINRRYDLEDFPDQDWDDVLATNLNGTMQCTKLVGRYMLAQGSGSIINIASLNSFVAGRRVGAYVASKGAVGQLTKAFANEWGGRGIRVNAIAPGYIQTDMTQALQQDDSVYSTILSRIPMQRWGRPSDIAAPAVFLASDAAAYVNGIVMPVDGGYLVT